MPTKPPIKKTDSLSEREKEVAIEVKLREIVNDETEIKIQKLEVLVDLLSRTVQKEGSPFSDDGKREVVITDGYDRKVIKDKILQLVKTL